LSYNNWRENSRVYSEIIQVDINLSFVIYYESFAPGGGTAGRITENEQNEILVEDKNNEENKEEPVALSHIASTTSTKMTQRGFRFQLSKISYRKRFSNMIDLIMIDKSTMTEKEKLIDDVWNEFMENYKSIQSFVDETTISSLFNQLIHKSNLTLSEDEDEEKSSKYIDHPIKLIEEENK
jgi:hypothetical protein